MIDLNSSRRDRFNECFYYLKIKDRNVSKTNQLIYDSIPDGSFYAKELNPYSKNNQFIAELFMIEEESVLISTGDDVSCLGVNDKIRMNNDFYIINNIQAIPLKRNNQYSTKPTKTYYIELRR